MRENQVASQVENEAQSRVTSWPSKRVFCGVLLTLVAITSCGGGSDCGNGPGEQDLSGFQLESREIIERYSDGSTATAPVAAESTIAFEDFSLEISGQLSPSVSQAKQPMFRLSLMNSAYACSFPPPALDENIEHISVTSNNDFSDAYLAGMELNELFEVYSYAPNPPADPELRQALNDGGLALNEFLSYSPTASAEALKLRLILEPASEQAHQFRVVVRLTNGQEFDLAAPTIRLE